MEPGAPAAPTFVWSERPDALDVSRAGWVLRHICKRLAGPSVRPCQQPGGGSEFVPAPAAWHRRLRPKVGRRKALRPRGERRNGEKEEAWQQGEAESGPGSESVGRAVKQRRAASR